MALTNLYLIGPMGAGKSSVGLQLAKLAGKTFYDTDVEIKQRTGVEISWIFAKEGEGGFRKRELELLQELIPLTDIVLSTGGGTIITAGCRDLLRQGDGPIIYLQVSEGIQIHRTANYRGHRPLIEEAENPVQALQKLNTERKALYESLADFTFLTDRADPLTVAKEILAVLEKSGLKN